MDWGATGLEPLAGAQAPPADGGAALLIHGGAWDIPDGEVDAHLDGLHRALARGQQLLQRGARALEVCVETVAVLEAHPAFDAGRGAVLDRDGRPQLDAGVMDGQTLAWGAVAGVRTVAHPVRVARDLAFADGQARLMVGEGAERFASECGHPYVDPERLVVPRERERWERLRGEGGYHTSAALAGGAPSGPPEASGGASPRGTVGCVARDRAGGLAAATSTGGAPFTRPGRVGDSPIVGSGFWASGDAALSATGWGEAIATVALCTRTADSIGGGAAPEAAAAERLSQMRETVRWPGAAPATGGLIALDARGRGGWAFTTPRMARGGWTPEAGAWAAVER